MASKRRLRRVACEGKVPYETEKDAWTAANSAHRRTGDWIAPYRCQFCHRFHIGHPPKHVRIAILRRR
jgi:hypothetical protein